MTCRMNYPVNITQSVLHTFYPQLKNCLQTATVKQLHIII